MGFPLKDKKSTITNDFQNIIDKSGCELNKIWVNVKPYTYINFDKKNYKEDFWLKFCIT